MKYISVFCVALLASIPLCGANAPATAMTNIYAPGTHQDAAKPTSEQLTHTLISQMQAGEFRNTLTLIDRTSQELRLAENDLSDDLIAMEQVKTAVEQHLKAMFSDDSSSSVQTQEIRRSQLRAQLADMQIRGKISAHLAHELKETLNDETQPPSPLSTLTDKHSSDLGMAAYHGGDGFFKMMEDQKRARALTKKTPGAVWEGFQTQANSPLGGSLSMPSIAGGIRNMALGTYGLVPFLKTDDWKFLRGQGWENNPDMHSTTTKGLAGAHLASRGANLMFDLATKSGIKITPEQARALAYHNRRHGVPKELQKFKTSTKNLAKIRFALRMLGLGMVPVALKGKHSEQMHTNKGLAVANATGIIDSFLGIADRIRTRRMLSTLKKRLPDMAKELKEAPPTKQELQEDQYAASDMGGGAQNMDMNAMFTGMGDPFGGMGGMGG